MTGPTGVLRRRGRVASAVVAEATGRVVVAGARFPADDGGEPG
ncbi:hypothetical protein [Micromonospora sp. NPDC023956]